MKKGLLLAACLILVFIAIGASGCTDYFGSGGDEVANTISSQQDIGIWVTGVGEVSVIPDIAVLVLGVEAQKDTVAEAQQAAAGAMGGVMNVLEDYGIDDKDIQTRQFSIQPVYRWDDGEQILLGYRVTNIVTVKIRDIDDTGGIIDDAVAAGGDYTRVSSVGFTIDEPEAYYEDAREDAMKDAKDKAQHLAELGGVKLGKLTYINEYSGYIPPPVIYRDVEEATSSSISPGELEIQLTVQVVYSIEY